MDSSSCLEKQKELENLFTSCSDAESRYQMIIEMGKKLPPFDPALKVQQNVVIGCQSTTYIATSYKEGKVYFALTSDALISAGLAALLLHIYDGESPETILKCPPTILEKIGIASALTPNRAQGLYSIHLRMKQEALKYLMGNK